jgi:hypothetical protein
VSLSIYLSMYSCFFYLEHTASAKRFVLFQFLNLIQSVGLLERGISPTQGRYLHRTTQTRNKRRQTSMPLVRFEPTIPVIERAKTFHVLDLAATVIGCHGEYLTFMFHIRNIPDSNLDLMINYSEIVFLSSPT